ncbi:MAG: NusA-like transcription termination signal-binding factor [Candidatus Aenigmatarchaeota archaeon]
MTIVFDSHTIKTITLFETLTHVEVKDCIINEDSIYFLVEEGKLENLKSNNGVSIKNLEKVFNKRIRVLEYSKDLVDFLKKSIKGVKEIRVRNEKNGKIVELTVDNSFKSFLIGKNGKNIKVLRQILKRNYQVDDVVVR